MKRRGNSSSAGNKCIIFHRIHRHDRCESQQSPEFHPIAGFLSDSRDNSDRRCFIVHHSDRCFICYDTAAFLDGNYAAFGRVIEGMETVDNFLKIERVYAGEKQPSKPVTPIVIAHAEVVDA